MNDRSQHTHNNPSPASESRTGISDRERAAKRVMRSATGLFIALLVFPRRYLVDRARSETDIDDSQLAGLPGARI